MQACLAAAAITGENLWAEKAKLALGWFLGRNDLHIPLYDEETGGCRDGLCPGGANQNQGAESTLAYLLSVLEMHLYENERAARSGGV